MQHPPAVNCDLAAFQGFRNTLCPVNVVREHGSTESEFSGIGLLDDFGFGIKLCNGLESNVSKCGKSRAFLNTYSYRTKYLLLHDARIIRDIGERSIGNKVALAGNLISSSQ